MKPAMMLSKLTLPRIQSHIWRRPRLARKIRGLLSNPVSLVVAGAGYGKTAAIASYLADHQISACWYRIDQDDATFPVFISYMAEAIRVRFPAFGEKLIQFVEEHRSQPITDACIRESAALFCNDAAATGEELLLILDQYHHVLAANQGNQWLQHVILHLPVNVRIVVISRVAPVWNWFSSSKLRKEAGEINETDFGFYQRGNSRAAPGRLQL